VLVNGGGRRAINYHSHLDHLRSLLRLLEGGGVQPARIALFSADGEDPALDLATREGHLPPDFWLLPRSLGRRLRPSIVYVNSKIEGFTLRPATREQLRGWFEEEGSALTAGDTLLFYVTDHGEKNSEDLTDNTITLWGEKLSVRELQQLLALLDPGVRVVMLMSQCYSGSFANAIFSHGAESLPEGNVCGYFSTTARRKAHGCYPEVSGREAVGHSHRILAALGPSRRLADAQREALVTDSSPDVPHASSSFFLEQRLAQAAARADRDSAAFTDELLAEALGDPLQWEPEIRLLDRVGRAFGFASPRSLAELEEHAQHLSELSERLDTYARQWRRAFDALRRENLREFRTEHPEWRARLKPRTLAALDPDARRAETAELLVALAAFTEAAPERAARLRELRWKSKEAKAAHYRAEVRLAAMLRMRALLRDIAGRLYMARYAPDEERNAFARLEACEDLALGDPPEHAVTRPFEPPEPFPTLSEERKRLAAIVPGWLGIRYRAPRPAERERDDLPPGAVVVLAVLPDSPAAHAQLRTADILLGPPDEPFTEPHAVREWTMQGQFGRPVPLRLLRDGQELDVTVRLAAFPLELPKLPGPPELGSAAPALQLEFFKGADRLQPAGSRLLFFWATWCSHCRKALPEVLAFGRARNVPVVAITDEAPDEIETFLERHRGPLPEIVATDRRRVSFQSYGVSGTPTFVWVDGEGIVRHYQVGYDIARGLEIEGWQWEEARTATK
jgi:thiol-disulfide isomerase/thioredoxin